ncbi:MAG TPA: MYXO-CTERM sorting domain-containing protein [Polyangiaceae bacterium]|nr:MYXO-CTERM sorting domain-containing protein [Polyangiaceae bacterium]
MKRSRWVSWCAVLAFALSAPGLAQGQVKVACAGEQTTHSLHRENDPEYPFLMGMLLDADFVATDKMAPHGGGFLEGGGSSFTIGNFGHPQASILDHALENPKTYLKSEELTLLSAFMPRIVVLGPFGEHDRLSMVPVTQFPTDFDALIAALQAIGSKPLVALATPLPPGGADKADVITQIKEYTVAAAAQHQLPTIDLWTEFLGKTTLFQDDTHLTADGRGHLAEFVGNHVKTLAQDLDEPPIGGSGGAGGIAGAGAGSAGAPAAGTGGAPTGNAGSNPSSAGSMAVPAGGSGSVTPSAGGPNDAAAPTQPSDPAGCGCRSVPTTGGVAGSAMLLGALALLRRRQQRPGISAAQRG